MLWDVPDRELLRGGYRGARELPFGLILSVSQRRANALPKRPLFERVQAGFGGRLRCLSARR